MAELKIKTTDGNNAVTIAGPASGADITLKLPTAAGSADQYLKTDGSNGQLSFDTISSTPDATIAKAWVNFDGTAGSISPRSHYNVASITDNGTGDYTINFTSNMPNTNYIVVGYAASPDSRYLVVGDEAWTRTFAVGSARISVSYVGGTNGETTECDGEEIYLVFFGG
tara:strand:+ start:2611 stop:3117 length:507 start_codon:yes stop_codon:yes gene_type:complete